MREKERRERRRESKELKRHGNLHIIKSLPDAEYAMPRRRTRETANFIFTFAKSPQKVDVCRFTPLADM